jgi:hypothetical protein
MRRQVSGSIVKRITHPKTKRTGTIRLDKSMYFTGTVDDDEKVSPLRSMDGRQVERDLTVLLSKTTAAGRLKWLPVVEIENKSEARDTSRERRGHVRGGHYGGEKLDAAISRYWIALTTDKTEWRSLKWEECDPESPTCIEENDRFAASEKFKEGPKSKIVGRFGEKPFTLPHFADGSWSGAVTILPYTPELWAGLVAALEKITEARETLERLTTTKAGIATLVEVGAGRLQLALSAGGTTDA